MMRQKGWDEDLGPYIERKIREAKEGTVWRPNHTATLEAVALGCARNGGAIDFGEDIKQQLAEWVEIGKKAQEKLDGKEKR